MDITIKNIGKIKTAKIDLSKNLIVFCGPNNSGKTYVSYTLYSYFEMLDFFGPLITNQFMSINSFIKKIDNKTFKLNLFDFFMYFRNKFEKITNSYLNSQLGSIVSNNFELIIDTLENPIMLKKMVNNFKLEESNKVNYENKKEVEFQILKIENSNEIQFKSDSPINKIDDIITNFIVSSIWNMFNKQFLNKSIIFNKCNFIPAERIGIAVFDKDLILNRFESSNSINGNNKLVFYPKPIADAITDQFRMSKLKLNLNTDFLDLAIELETRILEGEITIAENSEIIYNFNNTQISILNTASSIKSLASMVLYLKYYANVGSTLFIDEPELNLSADNQIIIARVLAKLSNLGVKIILSTHSDYILREFNSLIMLGFDTAINLKLIKKYKYHKKELLNYNIVGAYYFDKGTSQKLKVNKDGFEVKKINDTISMQNEIANNIYWTLNETN